MRRGTVRRQRFSSSCMGLHSRSGRSCPAYTTPAHATVVAQRVDESFFDDVCHVRSFSCRVVGTGRCRDPIPTRFRATLSTHSIRHTAANSAAGSMVGGWSGESASRNVAASHLAQHLAQPRIDACLGVSAVLAGDVGCAGARPAVERMTVEHSAAPATAWTQPPGPLPATTGECCPGQGDALLDVFAARLIEQPHIARLHEHGNARPPLFGALPAANPRPVPAKTVRAVQALAVLGQVSDAQLQEFADQRLSISLVALW